MVFLLFGFNVNEAKLETLPIALIGNNACKDGLEVTRLTCDCTVMSYLPHGNTRDSHFCA